MTKSIVNEEWMPVDEFEGVYEVSSLGRIRSRWSIGGKDCRPRVSQNWRVLKGSRHRLGYVGIELRHPNGSKTRKWVHRLVAAAFCDKPEGKVEVRHVDGNPSNNRAENLKWGTHAENQADIVVHKSCRFGETAPRTKIKNKQAIAIVQLYRMGGFTHKYLAIQFGVSPATIRRIVCGIKWSMITGLEKRKD